MDEMQFRAELHIRAFIDQIDGYPFGNPGRENFKPIVSVIGGEGKLDRAKTLALPCWSTFTDEQRALLLNEEK